ncbi:haloalkane dehalogenase [Sphingomonas sp. DBB INV C78]|uniref:haloalkane dehalogenase n=1 Tax=Sphingomonas sp. DBB INV C78 TaxID=3349434 RepID=UPI0036D364AC
MLIRPGVARTPDDRFVGLPDFPFAPHYLEVTDEALGRLRMHYLDEGPRDAPVMLLLHGEPSWCFLYRKMIGPLVAAGYRVVAPDHIGFGRSDKPTERASYSYGKLVGWLAEFVRALDLTRITLVCQDWGGPIGLRVLSEMPDRFAAVAVANTLLPTCEGPPKGVADWPGPIIEAWAETCRTSDDLPISEIIAAVCVERPAPAVLSAYDAPFPDAGYKAGTLQITCCIPLDDSYPGVTENKAAWKVLERFDRPFITLFSDSDPSTIAWEAVFQGRVPGAAGQPHARIEWAGHFLQEEQGAAMAARIVDWRGVAG